MADPTTPSEPEQVEQIEQEPQPDQPEATEPQADTIVVVEPAPRRRRTGLIAAIVVIGIIVVLGVVGSAMVTSVPAPRRR
jgi:hypothetical protein